MICLENVSKNYSIGVEALKNINMKIEDGEFVLLLVTVVRENPP